MALDGVVVFAEDHIDRFFNSCANMEIDPGIGREELLQLLTDLVAKVDGSYHFVYWQVTRGTAHRSHPFPDGTSNLWVMVEPEEKNLQPAPIQLLTVEDTRFSTAILKQLNLLPNVVAAQHAKEAGCAEAVFIRDGFVTECAHSNVHILKDGVFVTHQADNLILPGIARKHIISACERLGVPVEERSFTKAELMNADEIIVSASSEPGGVLANRIDGIPVGGRAAGCSIRYKTKRCVSSKRTLKRVVHNDGTIKHAANLTVACFCFQGVQRSFGVVHKEGKVP